MRTEEKFHLGPWVWDVEAALEALPPDPPVLVMPTSALANLLGLMHVDTEYAMTTDLTQPILLAPMPDGSGSCDDHGFHPYMVVIDGWHRIHRAVEEGVETLPTVWLSEEQSKAVLTDKSAKRR